jgi:uncharacterized protein YcbX
MAQSSGPTIRGVYRYPVKGLSPEPLERVELKAGETVPFDRAYAIENGPGRFDPDHPRYLPKIHFLMLMRDERLATLQTKFDDASATLTILRDGKQVARGQLSASEESCINDGAIWRTNHSWRLSLSRQRLVARAARTR